jgi:hypothetical protein
MTGRPRLGSIRIGSITARGSAAPRLHKGKKAKKAKKAAKH